jgi:uncharacterized protein
MSLKDEFKKMITALSERYTLPPISDVFLPPFHKGGQPKDSQFMAISIEGGAAGVSYVLIPDGAIKDYAAIQPLDFMGKDPVSYALDFGSDNPVKEMVSLAAINAICQHVMRVTHFDIGHAPDSTGMLSFAEGDRIGMVGLFYGLVRKIKQAGAELVVIEKKDALIEEFPNLPITTDPAKLSTCNKVLCTGTTVLNNSLDEILSHCSPDAFVSIIGPTAGYFPDPVFARGVDVVGGRVVKDGDIFLKRLAEKKRWGDAAQRTFFKKDTYTGII